MRFYVTRQDITDHPVISTVIGVIVFLGILMFIHWYFLYNPEDEAEKPKDAVPSAGPAVTETPAEKGSPKKEAPPPAEKPPEKPAEVDRSVLPKPVIPPLDRPAERPANAPFGPSVTAPGATSPSVPSAPAPAVSEPAATSPAASVPFGAPRISNETLIGELADSNGEVAKGSALRLIRRPSAVEPLVRAYSSASEPLKRRIEWCLARMGEDYRKWYVNVLENPDNFEPSLVVLTEKLLRFTDEETQTKAIAELQKKTLENSGKIDALTLQQKIELQQLNDAKDRLFKAEQDLLSATLQLRDLNQKLDAYVRFRKRPPELLVEIRESLSARNLEVRTLQAMHAKAEADVARLEKKIDEHIHLIPAPPAPLTASPCK